MSKFKHWTTQRLREVIHEPYNRGVNGKDYQDHIEEITEEFYRRMDKNNEKLMNRIINNYNKQESKKENN